MFCGRLILISFCCRGCGITTYVRASVMLSRLAFITSQFAARSRDRSKEG